MVSPNKEAVDKQWICKWIESSWNSLCYCYAICHSVINYVSGPVCGRTTCHQWIPVARDHWSGALVVQCAAIPSPVDPPPPQKIGLVLPVMLPWTSCLTNNTVASELKSPDAYTTCDVIVACHLSIRHSAWLNIRIMTPQLYWKSNRAYQIQKHRFDLCEIDHMWSWLRWTRF